MTRSRAIVTSRWIGVCLALASLLLPIGSVWSHKGIDQQISDLTAQIATDPRNANLYLRRGELHRIHRDWGKAEADYRKSLELDSELHIADFCLGRLKLESGQPAEARKVLNRYLAEQPTDSTALATRARALVALGQNLAAAEDFSGAIRHAKNGMPKPEYYLERARALEASGPSYLAAALEGLDDGLQVLGQPVTLQLYAIDLELARNNYDGALRRVDRIASQSVRQEPWLVRKATILEAAGRPEEARTAYEQTLASINTLPTSRRNNAAVARLEIEAREALKRLHAPPQTE